MDQLPFGMTKTGCGIMLVVLPFWAMIYYGRRLMWKVQGKPLPQHEAPFSLQVVWISFLLGIILAILGALQ